MTYLPYVMNKNDTKSKSPQKLYPYALLISKISYWQKALYIWKGSFKRYLDKRSSLKKVSSWKSRFRKSCFILNGDTFGIFNPI